MILEPYAKMIWTEWNHFNKFIDTKNFIKDKQTKENFLVPLIRAFKKLDGGKLEKFQKIMFMIDCKSEILTHQEKGFFYGMQFFYMLIFNKEPQKNIFFTDLSLEKKIEKISSEFYYLMAFIYYLKQNNQQKCKIVLQILQRFLYSLI